MQSRQLLNPKGIIIHGIPLAAPDFHAMAAAGTGLVWSPRSNVELYGATADVVAALDAGVDVALAPDWAITGSSNMLDELRFAARWNKDRLAGRLSSRQLVEMATVAAARIAGIADEVGALRPGLRADLIVIEGSHGQPYDAMVRAGPADVQLVVIDGVPLYGERTLMERFWSRDALEAIDVPGGFKTLATPAAGVAAREIAGRLAPALASQGTSLAPLAE